MPSALSDSFAATASRPAAPRRTSLTVQRGLTFVATAALVAVLALAGGTYDVVARQELGILVWWVVGIGVAAGLLQPWRRGWLLWAPVAALGALGAWTTISLDWTESTESTVAEMARITTYAGLLLLVLLVVRRRSSRAAIGGAATAAAGICLLALVDRLTGSTLSNADVINQAGSSRLSYPLNYWNAMGTWAAMTLALALSAGIHERRVAVRALAVAVVPIAAATAYLTYSRTSVVAVALGVAVVVLGARRRWTALAHVLIAGVASAAVLLAIRGAPQIANGTGTAGGATVGIVVALAALATGGLVALLTLTKLDRFRLPRRTGRATMAAVAAIVVVGGAVSLVAAAPSIERQFNNEGPRAVRSDDPASRLTSLGGNRTKVWSSALAAFEAHPATGVGAGAFDLWWNRDARNGEFVRDAHSLYLEALAELGVPGLLLVLLFAGSLLALAIVSRVRAPRGRREAGARLGALAVVAVFLVSAGVDWFWESTAVAALALIVAGASGAALGRDRRPAGNPGRAIAAGAGLIACLGLLPGLVSVSELRKSQSAFARGDVGAALADAQSARDAAPWAATPVMQQALIAEALGAYDAAERLLERAVAIEPTNFRPRVLLARVAAENGDLRLARSAYRQARRLRPLSPLFPVIAPAARPAAPSADGRPARTEGQ